MALASRHAVPAIYALREFAAADDILRDLDRLQEIELSDSYWAGRK